MLTTVFLVITPCFNSFIVTNRIFMKTRCVRIDWKQFYSQILSDPCLSRSLGLASMRPLLLRIPRQTNFNILNIYMHKKLLLNQINSGFLAMCRGFKEEEDPPAPEVVVSRHRQVCVNRTSELSGCNPHLTF